MRTTTPFLTALCFLVGSLAVGAAACAAPSGEETEESGAAIGSDETIVRTPLKGIPSRDANASGITEYDVHVVKDADGDQSLVVFGYVRSGTRRTLVIEFSATESGMSWTDPTGASDRHSKNLYAIVQDHTMLLERYPRNVGGCARDLAERARLNLGVGATATIGDPICRWGEIFRMKKRGSCDQELDAEGRRFRRARALVEQSLRVNGC